MLEAISTNYRGGYFDGKQYICVYSLPLLTHVPYNFWVSMALIVYNINRAIKAHEEGSFLCFFFFSFNCSWQHDLWKNPHTFSFFYSTSLLFIFILRHKIPTMIIVCEKDGKWKRWFQKHYSMRTFTWCLLINTLWLVW